MSRVTIPLALFLFLLVPDAIQAEPAPGTAPRDLATTLEPIRAAANLPALAAAVLRDGRVVALGAVGVRKLGTPQPVTAQDRFHLGSDTKALTGTLAAILVQEGRIGWQTTVGEVFPEEKKLDPSCRAITLEQLLNHRAGLPHDPHSEQPYMDGAWQERTPPVQQRLFLLRDVLGQPPEAPPGNRYAYSNVGYAVAGAMLEKRAGKPWEELLQNRLFEPLGMRSAGFGSPGRNGGVLGHQPGPDGKLVPVAPGPGDDNPAAIGPAATVHCTLEDWAKFVFLHLQGAHADTPLLKKAGFDKLHTPPAGQDYAMGWIAVRRPWAGGTALTHAGSNGMFFALAWLAPEKNVAFLVAANSGGEPTEIACDQAVVALLQGEHLIQATPPH